MEMALFWLIYWQWLRGCVVAMPPLTRSEEQERRGAGAPRRKARTEESRRAARLGGVLASELSERCTTSEVPFAAAVRPGLHTTSSSKDPTPTRVWFARSAQAGNSHFCLRRISVKKAKLKGFRQGKSQQCFSQQLCRQTAAQHTADSTLGGSQLCLCGVVSLQHVHAIGQRCRTDFWRSSFSSTAVDNFFPNW